MNKLTTIPAGANGMLKLPLGWRGAFNKLTIVGGPYDAFPGRGKMFGVCVRAERVQLGKVDVHLPIKDFQVPKSPVAVRDALIKTFKAGVAGRPVYVGCMGGWGRTGLFLALMAKTAGIEDPIGYVREHYARHAVETAEQQEFVETFDVTDVQDTLIVHAWLKRIPLLGWLAH